MVWTSARRYSYRETRIQIFRTAGKHAVVECTFQLGGLGDKENNGVSFFSTSVGRSFLRSTML